LGAIIFKSFKFVLFLWWYLAPCAVWAGNIPAEPASKEILDTFTAEEMGLLELTNRERARHKHRHLHLQPLKMNKILTDVARSQSISMASHHHLSHTVKGKSFAFRIKEAGYPIAKAGENVARSRHSLAHVMGMWMKSPGHRKNILNPRFMEVGFGIATTPNGDRYFTQVFGTQKIKKAEKTN